MRKITFLFAILITSCGFAAVLEEGGKDLCKAYIPLEKGTTLTYEDYNAKDKLEGSQTMTVTDVVETATTLTVSIHAVLQGKKEDEQMENDYEFTCEGGNFTMSMDAFMNPEMEENFKDMEIKIEQENLHYPSTMDVGQTLPDAHMTMEVYSNGMKIMTTNVEITNRKVESVENMETPAGTFPCIKLSQNTKSKTGFVTVEVSTTEWISENVGVVRSETYDKKGNLESYRILKSISKI